MHLPPSHLWVNLTLAGLTLPSPRSSGLWFSPDIRWQCRQLCRSRTWRCLRSWSRFPALHQSAWAHESFQHLHGVGEMGQAFLLSILHIFQTESINRFYFPISCSEDTLTHSKESKEHSDDQQLFHGVTCVWQDKMKGNRNLTWSHPPGWDISPLTELTLEMTKSNQARQNNNFLHS